MTEPEVGIGRLDVLDLRLEAEELRAAARELRAKAQELRARSAELRELTKRFTGRAEEVDGTARHRPLESHGSRVAGREKECANERPPE
jgi:hypothetical protein